MTLSLAGSDLFARPWYNPLCLVDLVARGYSRVSGYTGGLRRTLADEQRTLDDLRRQRQSPPQTREGWLRVIVSEHRCHRRVPETDLTIGFGATVLTSGFDLSGTGLGWIQRDMSPSPVTATAEYEAAWRRVVAAYPPYVRAAAVPTPEELRRMQEENDYWLGEYSHAARRGASPQHGSEGVLRAQRNADALAAMATLPEARRNAEVLRTWGDFSQAMADLRQLLLSRLDEVVFPDYVLTPAQITDHHRQVDEQIRDVEARIRATRALLASIP